nr:hypothetical protein [Corynebacterium sp. sy039]
MRRLNFLVTGFLNYAQDQAERRIVIKMNDWILKADQFIEFNSYEHYMTTDVLVVELPMN